jgi:hypothetical protein
MKNVFRAALAAAVVLGLVAVASAETVTVTGKLACAHCTLKKADVKACQDVLVVAGKEGAKPVEYWMVKNAVVEKVHVCKGEKNVTVTGAVEEKDGKKWLTATKADEAK